MRLARAEALALAVRLHSARDVYAAGDIAVQDVFATAEAFRRYIETGEVRR